VVVVTEGGGLVDNTCAVGIGDIGVVEDPESHCSVLCKK
jgi:hypothetical protein